MRSKFTIPTPKRNYKLLRHFYVWSPFGTLQKKWAPGLLLNLEVLRFIFLQSFLHWKRARLNSRKLTLLFPMLWFKKQWCIVFRLVLAMLWSVFSSNRRLIEKRDENDFLRVSIMRLTLVSPGVVDCSLAVTNNSLVWCPQGTHSEAYPCITWCSLLFISSD